MNAMTKFDVMASVLDAEADAYLSGASNWRSDVRPSRADWSRTWDRPGVEALVNAAAAEFEAVTGVMLPYNLATHGPWVDCRARGWIVDEDGTADAMVGAAARFAGWLRAVAGDPLIVELIRRTTSPRGMKSPATSVYLYDLAERWTPGALSRHLRQIKARADQVLRPYGLRVSWRALAKTLEQGPRRTGKAAIYAAALTLGMDTYARYSYADARNHVASVSRTALTKVDATATDGVYAFIDWHQSRTLHGVTVSPVVILAADEPQVRQPAYLVRGFGRTWHSPDRWAPAGATPTRYIIGEALAAWTKRRKAERAAAHRDDRLSRVSVLVRIEDSLDAGNCKPGTLAFQQEQGWVGRWYVPASWLDATGRPLAKNAARVAEAAVLRQMAA